MGIIILILGLSFNEGSSQNIIEKVLSRSYVKFSGSAFLSDKLNLANNGTSLLSTSAGLGGEATILFSTPIFKNFNINTGIGWSVYSYNYSYHFLVPEGGIFDTGTNPVPFFTTRGYDPHEEKIIYTIPISLQKVFQIKNTIDFSLEAGVKINIKESFPYGLQSRSIFQFNDHTKAEYFRYDFESSGKKTFTSYIIKTGLTKRNNRGNLYHFNIVYHYSPAIIGIGDYEFSNLGFESFGTMKQHVNYFGLEIGYGLSLKIKNP